MDPAAESLAAQQLDDNSREGLSALRALNKRFRISAWPPPFDRTRHTIRRGDARDLRWITDESVHLVVTSPHIGI